MNDDILTVDEVEGYVDAVKYLAKKIDQKIQDRLTVQPTVGVYQVAATILAGHVVAKQVQRLSAIVNMQYQIDKARREWELEKSKREWEQSQH